MLPQEFQGALCIVDASTSLLVAMGTVEASTSLLVAMGNSLVLAGTWEPLSPWGISSKKEIVSTDAA